MKWLKRLIITLFLTLLCLPLFLLDTQPQVVRAQALNSERVASIRSTVQKLHQQLRQRSETIDMLITPAQLAASADLMSISIPKAEFEINSSAFGVKVAATGELLRSQPSFYVNANCLFTNGFEGMEIDHCRVGRLYFPGVIVDWMSDRLFAFINNQQGVELWRQTLANARTENDGLRVANVDVFEVKQNIKASIQQASSLIGDRNPDIAPLVKLYLGELAAFRGTVTTLDEAVHLVFRQVGFNTELRDNDILSEHNEAAIWALAITYGNPRFAQLLGIAPTSVQRYRVSLNGRNDLTQHFLYSAMLEINGGEEAAFNIGEMKELMDSMKGGSGYSFADIVADVAGIQFAKFMRNKEQNLVASTTKLVNESNSELYMMSVKFQPEGLSDVAFKRQFGGVDSLEYKKAVAVIQDNIRQLPLYQ